MEPTDSDRGAETASPPQRIGPYRILEPLGEGGMGTVYLAEQSEPVRRRVALKVIKLGMDSRAVLARFEAERQVLAIMEHGNIANVLDAGLAADGRPYFAMEYVRGVPLTDYCREQGLDLAARIELFCQVCAGVQHAHHKGVVHRDLKPANILVARDGERAVPKIIDFGLARATDHALVRATLCTEQGQIIGTPEYMSPEQAWPGNRDVDTRTDVYSLGVLLYELLVGELPYPAEALRRGGLAELQRLVREVEPPRPSVRLGELVQRDAAVRRERQGWLRPLRGDLDWIVLRALAKEPARRYQSPLELADDLQRNLRHEPVEARPPTLTYRVGKFVRKHRPAVLAAAVVLLAIVAGGVVSTLLLFAARAARDHAERAVLASEVQLARTQMAALDLAAWWTSQSIAAARAPTLDEVRGHEIDGRRVLAGLAQALRDPWGGAYRLEPAAMRGDWQVVCDGPDRRAGSADDLAVHDPLFTHGTLRRLERLFEERAERLLDLAQEMAVVGRARAPDAAVGPAMATDPWGAPIAVQGDAAAERLTAHSAGPDAVPGTADDLAVVRPLLPAVVEPDAVAAQIGRSRRICCILQLAGADPGLVVGWLQLLVESGDVMKELTMRPLGDALALLGPPDQVAFAVENARQFGRSALRGR